MKKYNTVKTAKLVDEREDLAARQAIDSCSFLTPETERDIDLALGIGSPEAPELKLRVVFDEEEVEDIMVAAGPSSEALAQIEAEEKTGG